MKYTLVAAVTALALATIACDLNTSGLDKAPRATFSQLACLDNNGDDRITGEDADAGRVPDFNADGDRDDDDRAFLEGVDIALNPNRDKSACEDEGENPEPDYLVAHGFFADADVTCDEGDEAVLLLGIGGAVKNLRKEDTAAGVRSILDAMQKEYDDNDVQTIGIVAGQEVVGAEEPHPAMEQWLTHAMEVYLERFPCLRLVLLGHSHGAVTVAVIGARLEDRYADRIVAVVPLDRVEEVYGGDLQAYPQRAPVFNIFQTRDPIPFLRGYPVDQSNVENWDASDEPAPEHGEEGGAPAEMKHTRIDNAETVRERIVREVMERSELSAAAP